ncbi:MAG: FMN-dependent NADH-azoreductase [Halothiobacillaceae bacterium]
MSQLLVIEGSVFGENGQSTGLARHYVEAWKEANPEGSVRTIDVVAEPFAPFDTAAMAALSAEPSQRDAQQAAMVAKADDLIEAFQKADRIVLCAPMYNFHISSHLKSALDWLARAGVTFRYTENGAEGLLPSVPVIVISTRGGHYHEAGIDHQLPYLRQFLSFVGLDDVTVVLAEGLNSGGEEAAKASIEQAKKQLSALV